MTVNAEVRVLQALGLAGRPITKAVLTFEYGQVPTLEITEHRVDLYRPGDAELPVLLSMFDLVERPDVAEWT